MLSFGGQELCEIIAIVNLHISFTYLATSPAVGPWPARLRAASGHKERVDFVFSSNFLFVLVQEVGIRLQVNSLCKHKHLSFEAHQVVK